MSYATGSSKTSALNNHIRHAPEAMLLNTDDEMDSALSIIAAHSRDKREAETFLKMLGYLSYVGTDTHRPGDLSNNGKPRMRFANGALRRYEIGREAQHGASV